MEREYETRECKNLSLAQYRFGFLRREKTHLTTAARCADFHVDLVKTSGDPTGRVSPTERVHLGRG
jgi:hypothetical protein